MVPLFPHFAHFSYMVLKNFFLPLSSEGKARGDPLKKKTLASRDPKV